jgi:malonate transporter
MRRLAPLAPPVGAFFSLLGIGALFPGLRQVLDLALPFFGLILLGYVAGKLTDIPESGLAWMQTFVIYVALPALFFNIIAATPIGQLANGRFVLLTLSSTALIFIIALVTSLRRTGGDLATSAIQATGGAYANVGYMGPGLTLVAMGPDSAVPVALIFVFDSLFFFTVVPLLMGIAGAQKGSLFDTLRFIVWRVATHPFNIATAAGFVAAALQMPPPVPIAKLLGLLQGAAAPCALFVMGVTVAQRPLRKIESEMPLLLVLKLLAHPLMVWVLLSAFGDFGRIWTFSAVLMASLPPALSVFVIATQYQTYVERSSQLVLAGTVASVITVTAWLYFIAAGTIPYNLFGR